MVMYAVFKEQKREKNDLWMDADVEAIDLLPSKQDAKKLKNSLESMNNQNHLTRFRIQPQQI